MSRFSRNIVHGNTSRALTKNILAMFSRPDDPRDMNFDDDRMVAPGSAPYPCKKDADNVYRSRYTDLIGNRQCTPSEIEDDMIENIDRKRNGVIDLDEEECEVDHDFVFPDEDEKADQQPEAALYRAIAASLVDAAAQRAFREGMQAQASCAEHREAENLRTRVMEFSPPRFPRTSRPLARPVVQEIRVSY